MTTRKRLPNRRLADTFAFEVNGQRYIATVGHFPDGTPAELFINSSMRLGTDTDTNAMDGSVAVSLALQYGCPPELLRDGMKRNADGSPQGPLGAALDVVVARARP